MSTSIEDRKRDEADANMARWINPVPYSPPSQAFRAISGTAAEEKTSFRWDLVAAGLSGALVFAIWLRLVERR